MSKSSSIEDLINDLDYLENNMHKICDERIDNIVAQLMTLIGKSTAYDTGVARDLIKNVLRDMGREDLIPSLEYSMYEFWKTREKRELEGSTYEYRKFSKSNENMYNISIYDDGFVQQQDGVVSKIHPRNDSDVRPSNVDFYIDVLETGASKELESAINELLKLLIKAIEGDVK